jgi:4'-phosphopantetheinyl transferase
MSEHCNWEIIKTLPVLKKRQPHVWCASLERTEEELALFFAWLSADEQQRAQRFHFANDRAHFIAARGLLRNMLGGYLSIDPSAVHFSYNACGKPELTHFPALQFNVSHSHGAALYAVAQQQPVGIDIEYMKRACDMDAIVERYFSANEARTIKNLAGVEKTQAFFNGWARKEAFLKALGAGLSYPLNQVEVTLTAQEPAQFITLHDNEMNAADWHLQALTPLADYAAAIVIKGEADAIKTGCWQSVVK